MAQVPVLVQVPLPLPEPAWREMDSVRQFQPEDGAERPSCGKEG